MLSELTPSELGEWLAEYTISPWGEWRGDWRMAQFTSIYAEVHRNREERGEPFSIGDFMYESAVEKREQAASQVDLSTKLKAALLGRNATLKGKRK